jgi:spermidine synthase
LHLQVLDSTGHMVMLHKLDNTQYDLDVVVGGLGLGYTAQAVLEHEAVKSLVIVEALAAARAAARRAAPGESRRRPMTAPAALQQRKRAG